MCIRDSHEIAYAAAIILMAAFVYLAVAHHIVPGEFNLGWILRMREYYLPEGYALRGIAGTLIGLGVIVRGIRLVLLQVPDKSFNLTFRVGLFFMGVSAIVDIILAEQLNVFIFMVIFFAAGLAGLNLGHLVPESAASAKARTWQRIIRGGVGGVILIALFVTAVNRGIFSIVTDPLQSFFLQTARGLAIIVGVPLLLVYERVNRAYESFFGDEEFISEKDGGFLATRFGQKVSRLYIDPMTARDFRNAIEYDIVKGSEHTFGFLHLVTTCDEFYPTFDLRQKDLEKASIVIENNRQTLIRIIQEEDCSRSLLALDLWTNEGTEINLSEELGIESGDMHRMAETAEWLVYSLRELSREFRREDLVKELDILRKRIVYGIKHELIDLVRIRNVGRVRARILYKNGYKNRTALKKAPLEKLAEIDKIGMAIALSLIHI